MKKLHEQIIHAKEYINYLDNVTKKNKKHISITNHFFYLESHLILEMLPVLFPCLAWHVDVHTVLTSCS